MTRSIFQLDSFKNILDKHREQLNRFAELLIAENQKYNLTRIDSPQQIETRHFLDSLAGLAVLDEASTATGQRLKILDTGSGAGFPGLVLAMVRPDWTIVSLEATEKKVRFQQQVCSEVGLANVTVLHGRAESLAHDRQYREQFDAVTARALAAMPVLAELSLAFVKHSGLGLYWKGPSAREELPAATPAIRQMGAVAEKTLTYRLPTDEGPATLSLVVCRKTKKTPTQYPRVFGMIKKNPL